MVGNPESNASTKVRPEVLEEMIHVMRQALVAGTEHLDATPEEVFSAVFTLTMRVSESGISMAGRNNKAEWHIRKQLTVLCEKLWISVAGEPFTRDRKKRALPKVH